MTTQASVRHAGNVAIVDLSGPVTMGEGSGLVRSTIKDLVGNGHRQILVNLQNVAQMDSSGLGELVGTYATLSNLGGNIKLVHVAGRVGTLLEITKLYTVLHSFSDEAEALRSFPS